MNNAPTTSWLQSVTARQEGYEWQAVEQFSNRLLKLAKSRLPEFMHAKVDAEDVVQSVFKSFFQRNEAGQFSFDETQDLWRLLAAITYRKVQRAMRFHLQQQRDVRREQPGTVEALSAEHVSPTASSLFVMAESLESILAKLPPTHRSVLQLRMDGHSITDIAQQLNLSTRTVDRGLSMARKIAEEEVHE